MLLTHKINIQSYQLEHPIINSINLYKFTEPMEYIFIPEGCFELIFQLNGSTWQKFLVSSNWEKRPNCFIGGLHNKAYLVKPEIKNQYSIGIKLKPDTANILFRENLTLFKNQIVNIQNVFNNSLNTLINAINHDNSFDTICRLTVHYFNIFYKENLTNKNLISASEIIKNNGRNSISQLSQKANLSDSHYRKLFRESIGLSPREYMKIIRVNTAIRYLKNNTKDISLTKAALDLGYFDQSHFIKEFKSIAHLPPSKFLT